MPATVVVGTHTFAVSGDGARRQQAAMQVLMSLSGATLENVQFADGGREVQMRKKKAYGL